MSTSFVITLENIDSFTKKQIQEENVSYGLARCDNELKEKSVKKLKEHLKSLEKKKTCTIQLDGGQVLEIPYPAGKTRLDFNKVVSEFFKF